MCDSTRLPQNTALALGPGIVGLFIQGIESGLVLAYFCRWLCTRGHGRYFESTIVIFVTLVGLAQSGIYFASTWTRFVQQFGITPTGRNWGVCTHLIPTLLISVPVQVFMIRRCSDLVRKNLFIVTPLVLLLVASTVMSLWSIVLLVDYLIFVSVPEHVPASQWVIKFGPWPYLVSVVLTSVLDLILTGIMLYHLVRMKNHVYSANIRKQISRFVNVVWQAALPQTLCAICLSVLFIQYYATACESKSQFWLTVVHAMIGKLYVLSLFYLIEALQHLPLQHPDEQSSTVFISTLLEQTEVINTLTQDASVGGDVCGGVAVAEYEHEKTIGFAV